MFCPSNPLRRVTRRVTTENRLVPRWNYTLYKEGAGGVARDCKCDDSAQDYWVSNRMVQQTVAVASVMEYGIGSSLLDRIRVPVHVSFLYVPMSWW